MTEPTYFERDRYDLPLPLIGIDPNPIASETTLSESLISSAATAQQRQIFQALTQVLTPLGVRFKFSIQHRPPAATVAIDRGQTMLQSPDTSAQPLDYRLLVRCNSPKSLDCQLLAEPLARALRQLDLQGFQDAIVRFATGADLQATSNVADWRLRVDLTPPIVRLKNWARWGDVQAITQLLNLALAHESIQVSAIFQNLTLQIFCTLKQPQAAKFPPKKQAIDIIAPLLIALAPQGIQGATIHGLNSGAQIEEPPVWMHWLDLPALGDPKFSPTPIVLAGRGDEDALHFILERLLNPDLDRCFEIGGIELSLLYHQHLLYVMSEAPICPIQSQVATTVVKVLTQLRLSGIKGVRVHGRITGQSIPQWTYGVDFDREPLELPPVAPAEQFTIDPSVTKIGVGERISNYLAGTGIWKPQFDTVKGSQLVYQPRFQWQPSLLLLLVGLGLAICGDLTMKVGLANRQLGEHSTESTAQLSFNNPLLEQKLAQYQLRCLQHGVPDVLIVGSSRALRGIDPEVLRRSAIDRGLTDPKIYNFGINGATAQVVDTILRQLLTPQQLPKIVIWADGARAFNSGRIDRTYEAIALSERYRQLAIMSGITNSSSSLLQAQSSLKNTYQSIDSGIDRQLDRVSLAYHHRDRLKTWLQSRVPLLSQLADSSNSISNLDPAASISDREIDFDGFLAVDFRFDPDTYYQKYTKVTGDSDGDYANFQLAGSQDRALHQTIDLLAAHKIPLIFVNVPLSDIYLDKFRRQHETVFKQYMQNLMATNRLTFLDLDGFLNKQYDRFSDPSHLNQVGAREVSRYLAQTQSIPWKLLNPNPIVSK